MDGRRGYGPGSYLADRIVSIALWLVAAAVICGTLSVTQVAAGVIPLVLLVMMGSLGIDLALGYLGHRRFWRAVAAVADDEAVSPLDAAQNLPYPASSVERLSDAALAACGRAGADEAARARREAEDYRSFVEAWSHEVKTPIHTATLLSAGDPSPTGQAMAAELERVDGYVEQALYYARSTSVERDFAVRETDLACVVRDAIHQRTSLLLAAGVRVELGELGYRVLCDAKWVRFMLGQLIDNACKYQDALRHQVLTFSARQEGEGTAEERVVLTVADTGLGIPSEDLPRIFDKGFVGENGRAEGQAASTGLGLYLVRTLAAKTGLAVSAASEPGAGTRFEIAFPMNRFRYLGES